MNPVERASAALWASVDSKGIDGRLYRHDCDYLARTVFESIDVGELAEVLHDAACTCDGTAHTRQWWENRERSARAVVAHLTKGGENDE